MTDKTRVLVADDNASDRIILANILKKEGYEVLLAKDGVEAVEIFEESQPHIVLMDAMMPRLNGMEATVKIKAQSSDRMVPVIFLTSLQEADELAGCLDAGGDDFLSKPYSRVVLQAKLKAFDRMRSMHDTMTDQRDQIALANAHLIHEQHVAKTVFDRVAHSGCLKASNIKHILSPLAVFNGDVLLAMRNPTGGMHVLLGDFTGHGLGAAIGAMPMAEIFYGMTRKGFSISEIITETNRKLKRILPVGVFCCASIIDLNFRKSKIRIWHGGLPEAQLRRASGEIDQVESRNLPLGVLGDSAFKDALVEYDVQLGDRLYVYSDGIVEAENAQGKMFGPERLASIISSTADPDEVFDEIRRGLRRFVKDSERTDDLTLLELQVVAEADVDVEIPSMADETEVGPSDWQLFYELGPGSLRDFNPLPLIQTVLMDVPGLRSSVSELLTVLTELYTNALEHGVLELGSEMKSSPQGFVEYYEEKSRRLQMLSDGYVCFDLKHVPEESGGALNIKIRDSGNGFDFENTEPQEKSPYAGRGIKLINELCESIEYRGPGNEVEVSYRWRME